MDDDEQLSLFDFDYFEEKWRDYEGHVLRD
jgi:hypothetical protein